MAYSLNPSADSCYDGTFCRKYFDYRRIKMRKSAFLLSLICLFATFLLVSCGGNSESEDGYVTACEALSKTSMGSTEYSAAEIDELEARFVKMALSGGFSRVNHFRSTSEYAYVIEFENPDDAIKAYTDLVCSRNVVEADSTEVRNESDHAIGGFLSSVD